MTDLREALEFSKKTILKAGKLLLETQQSVKVKGHKDRVDIVTNVDIETEKLIISAIEKKYPTHSISSEEKGFIDKKSPYLWIIDPLDGTKEYFRQIPSYNASLCLLFNEIPILSAVYLPYSNQIFSAADKIGAFLNGEKIKVNSQAVLKNSIIYLHPPCFGKLPEKDFEKNFIKIKELTKNVYRLRYHQNQNTFLCFLALGSAEAYINFSYPPSMEDFAPGLFIAKMAGAKITDLKGEKIDLGKSKQLYIASNGKIHEQVLKVINNNA